ncbi:MAG: NAD-dependent epimerase/dehydratase family protein [Candidatus Atabeyarchaeum deiterrae]
MRSKELQASSRRIVVTGGAGFIGSHLVDALATGGCTVTVFDDLSSGTLKNIQPHLESDKVCFAKGDIRNERQVQESLRNADIVFHLAALTSVSYSIEKPMLTNEVNVGGTRNLLEASIRRNVKRFVYVSSCAVYGNPQYVPIDENHPMSPYADSKVEAEEHCKEYQREHGLKTVILRLFNVYGPRQTYNLYSGVISKFIEELRKGKRPLIYGDGQQTRDFVHVSDVVQALLLSASADEAVGQAFNIGSGDSVTINRLYQLIREKLRVKTEPVYEEPRLGEIKHSLAEISKARQILGYQPATILEKGLESLIGG